MKILYKSFNNVSYETTLFFLKYYWLETQPLNRNCPWLPQREQETSNFAAQCPVICSPIRLQIITSAHNSANIYGLVWILDKEIRWIKWPWLWSLFQKNKMPNTQKDQSGNISTAKCQTDEGTMSNREPQLKPKNSVSSGEIIIALSSPWLL